MSEFMSANPCPFCAAISEPELGQSFVDPNLYGCFICEVFAPREVWDNRPVEDALQQRIAELGTENDSIKKERNKFRNLLKEITDGMLTDDLDWLIRARKEVE